MAKPHSQPFRGFLDVMSQMERMRALGRTGESLDQPSPRTQDSAWVPTADVFALGADLVISVELAGVPPSAVDISLSQGVLTVSGERATVPDPATTSTEVTPYVRERYYGAFRRSVLLPSGVDERRITATIELGVVTVTVPGAAGLETPRSHRIRLEERS